jgi:hypothetical protein
MHGYISILVRGALLAVAVALAACSNPFSDDAPTFDQILSAGWLNDDDPPALKDPVYCYDTIGAPDCHAVPLAREGGRLRGFEGPAPVLRIEK